MRAGVSLDGAADHGVSEALYLRDPDENGAELYWHRSREDWPQDAGGRLGMYTRPLDLGELLKAIGDAGRSRVGGEVLEHSCPRLTRLHRALLNAVPVSEKAWLSF